jgi:flagellar basal-body rod protein FlgB
MWDVSTDAVVAAIDGLAMRGSVRAHNVANAETPNFIAKHVEFESTLRDAIQRGNPRGARHELVDSPTIVDGNGNSVDIETELISSMKDGLLRDTMTAAFNFKVGNLRMAIGGRR